MAMPPSREASAKFSTAVLPLLSTLSSTTLHSNITSEEAMKQRELEEFYATYNVWTGIRTAATLSMIFLFTVTVIIYKSKCKRHRKYELYPSLEDLPGRPLDYYDYWPTQISCGDNVSNHSRRSDDKDFFCRIYDDEVIDETGSAPLPTLLLGEVPPSLRNSFRVKSLPGSVMRMNLSRMNSLEKDEGAQYVMPSCHSTPRNKHPSDETSQKLNHVVENSLRHSYLNNQESSAVLEMQNAEGSGIARNSSPSWDSSYGDSPRSREDTDSIRKLKKRSTFGSPRDLKSSIDLSCYKTLKKLDTFESPRDLTCPKIPSVCDSETNTEDKYCTLEMAKGSRRNYLNIQNVPGRRYSVDTGTQMTPRKLKVSGSLKIRNKVTVPEKQISLKDLENYRISSDLLSERSKIKLHSFGSPKDLDNIRNPTNDKLRTSKTSSDGIEFLRKPNSFHMPRNLELRRASRNNSDSRGVIRQHRSFICRGDLDLRKQTTAVDSLLCNQDSRRNEASRIPSKSLQSPRSPKSIDSHRSISYSDQLWKSSRHDSLKKSSDAKTKTIKKILKPGDVEQIQNENILEIS